MKQMDIGFNPNRLCFIDIPDRGILRRSFLREEIQPIKRLSEIENVSYSASGKITVNNVPDLAIFNDDRDTLICQGNVVSVSYFDVCGIKCLQGELFRENEPDWNNDKIIINE